MFAGFLVVRVVDPETFGTFSGVGVFLGYVLLGHGGVINGLSRELPYELGKGNDGYAKDLASSTFALTSLISAFAALIFLTFSIYHFSTGNETLAIIFLSYVIMGAVHLFNKQFLPVLYRTNKDFNSLSRQNILIGIGNIISVVFVWQWGLWGLCIRGVVMAIYESILLYRSKPYTLYWQLNFEHYKKLFRSGIPIYMVGYVNPLWATVLNNMIFSLGGAVSFGYYALANIVQGAVGVIPTSFSQVIYPRMAIMYGEGKTIPFIIKANIKPLIFQFGVLLMVGIVGAAALPYVIPLLLPKYVTGVQAAQWMMFVPVAQSLGALGNLYNVVKRQRLYFVSLLTGSIIGTAYILMCYYLYGFSLLIFPQGLILGKITQQILAVALLRSLYNRDVK